MDWKTETEHREFYFYLEQELGIKPNSVEAFKLWTILETIRQENSRASGNKKPPISDSQTAVEEESE